VLNPECVPVVVPSEAIQVGAQPEYLPSPAAPPRQPEPRRGRYESWDDFRSNSPAVESQRIALATQVLPDLRGMSLEPIPDGAPPTDSDLGSPLASVTLAADGRPSGTLNIHQLLYGGVLAVAMLVLAFLEQQSYRKTSLAVLIGLCGLLVGVWCASWRGPLKGIARRANPARPFQSMHLWLFENGLFWQHGSEYARCAWEEIEEFRVGGTRRQPHYRVKPRRELEMVLTLSDSPAIMPLAEYVEIKIASAQLLPTLRRIVAGEEVSFGAVSIDRRRFVSPGFAAPWSDVARVMADRSTVFVDCRGRPNWQQIRYRDVSCPLLTLAVAHILIEDGPRLPPEAS
jgi:hypothetical protein